MNTNLNRRDFLKTSATLAAGATLASRGILTAAERTRAIGANDRIRIGLIGCGDRGVNTHMASIHKHAQAENLTVVAVCDPWSKARDNAAAKAKEWLADDVKQCRTYHELLDLPEVDAVMIASCDHWHSTHLEAATKAGRHVYVEKPMAIEFDELTRAYEAAKKSGVVIQVGTQSRSSALAGGCRALVKAGTLGKLSRIEQVRNGEKPYWYHYLKPDVQAADLDWKEFTKGRTKKPFDPILYSGWYGYWEFSQGPVPQLGVHFLDLMHFITGIGFPETCVCLGGTYTWKDEHQFTAPDQVQALWNYPEGVLVSYSSNFGNSSGNLIRLSGDKGTLNMEALWSNEVTYTARGGINRDGGIRGENKVTPIEQTDHWVNWYRCMRNGETPNAPLDAGYQHSIASIMATMALETGRRTRFNAQKRKITLD
jgi:predicted dehydrogenase